MVTRQTNSAGSRGGIEVRASPTSVVRNGRVHRGDTEEKTGERQGVSLSSGVSLTGDRIQRPCAVHRTSRETPRQANALATKSLPWKV